MRKAGLLLFIILAAQILPAQPTETPEQKNARMAWWKEARFGLFIHWGLYAVPAGTYGGKSNYGEWIMEEAHIPVAEYEKYAAQFNPRQFNAQEWVTLAKNAGMKYIVITSKHHDGFCLFDSKVSDYDILDRTPFKRDPLQELAEACQKEDIKLCFYHSIMDWHHPDAKKERFEQYRENYLKPQIRELLTRYGPIGVLWFDGEWIDEWTEAQGKDLYQFARDLQPDLIVNNRVGKGRNGMQGMSSEAAAGDFGTPEQEILQEKSALDWESCMTMNNHWGYNKNDLNYKRASDLIWNIADICGKGGNYLLNVGPTAAGQFPEMAVDRLKTIGEWTKTNAEAIYGTGPWTYWNEGENIRFAQGKNGRVYVFVRPGDQQTTLLLKKMMPNLTTTVQLLGYPENLKWEYTANGLLIHWPEPAKLPFYDQVDWTWVLSIDGTPAPITEKPMITLSDNKEVQDIVFAREIAVEIKSVPGSEIHYTTDGTEPTADSPIYSDKLHFINQTTLKVIAKSPDKMISETAVAQLHKARYGLELESPYAKQYAASGPLSLVDGRRGSTVFTDGKWLGFEGQDFSAVLDMGQVTIIEKVGLSCLENTGSWIFPPVRLEAWISDDGEHFALGEEIKVTPPTSTDPTRIRTFEIPLHLRGRYVRLVAVNQGVNPAWHAGAGGKSWLFLDEVWAEEKR